jgi:hypothetical protein
VTVRLSVVIKDSRGRKTLARLSAGGTLKRRDRVTFTVAKATAKLKPGSQVQVEIVADVGKTIAGATSVTLRVPSRKR